MFCTSSAQRQGVNFISILRQPFAPIFLRKKIQFQNITREKMRKAFLYEKL